MLRKRSLSLKNLENKKARRFHKSIKALRKNTSKRLSPNKNPPNNPLKKNPNLTNQTPVNKRKNWLNHIPIDFFYILTSNIKQKNIKN
jgi:hypothetical protein